MPVEPEPPAPVRKPVPPSEILKIVLTAMVTMIIIFLLADNTRVRHENKITTERLQRQIDILKKEHRSSRQFEQEIRERFILEEWETR
jgi:hypothetical protein